MWQPRKQCEPITYLKYIDRDITQFIMEMLRDRKEPIPPEELLDAARYSLRHSILCTLYSRVLIVAAIGTSDSLLACCNMFNFYFVLYLSTVQSTCRYGFNLVFPRSSARDLGTVTACCIAELEGFPWFSLIADFLSRTPYAHNEP